MLSGRQFDKVIRGGGPENTLYDRQRHERMRLRPMGMYGILKSMSASQTGICSFCGLEIFGQHLENNTLHNWCFNERSKVII